MQEPAPEKKPKPDNAPARHDATGRLIRESTPPPVPERKPDKTINNKHDRDKKILDFIGGLESTNNYNVIVGGVKAPLTKMTIKEVGSFRKNARIMDLERPLEDIKLKIPH